MITDKDIITLKNNVAECTISVFGGQVLSYRPLTQKHDVFWLGSLNKFDNVQPIRGGIPVCWPRFGADNINLSLPRHGFSRISQWKIKDLNVDDSKMFMHLCLDPDNKYQFNALANLFINITDKFEYTLETHNCGNSEISFSEALHAYFHVGSRNMSVIKGFNGYEYKNALDGNVYALSKDLVITDQFDAVFNNHTDSIEIADAEFNRIIKIKKEGSKSTVVWNPNKDVPEARRGQYNNFICVEPANMGENFITLAPNQKHKICMTIEVKDLGRQR